MKKLILVLGILFVLFGNTRMDAAMVRVVEVRDARTLVVERNGARETLQLAGVEILDPTRAADLLRWNVVSTWVMVEAHASGGWLVFRSPDALFINRELVLRGYARATEFGIEPDRNLAVTYLGTIDPPARIPSNVTSTSPGTSSGKSRRSKASRPPKTRSPGGRSSSRKSAGRN